MWSETLLVLDPWEATKVSIDPSYKRSKMHTYILNKYNEWIAKVSKAILHYKF